MIAGPINAFLQSLHGANLAAILTALAIVGLLAVKIDAGNHQRAMMWFIGFLVTVGFLVAVAGEGTAWFAGV